MASRSIAFSFYVLEANKRGSSSSIRFSSYSSTLNRESKEHYIKLKLLHLVLMVWSFLSVSTLHFTVGVVAKDPDLIFLLELWINSAALLLMVFVLVTAAVGGAGCGSATAAGGAGMGTAFSGALGTVVLPGL